MKISLPIALSLALVSSEVDAAFEKNLRTGRQKANAILMHSSNNSVQKQKAIFELVQQSVATHASSPRRQMSSTTDVDKFLKNAALSLVGEIPYVGWLIGSVITSLSDDGTAELVQYIHDYIEEKFFLETKENIQFYMNSMARDLGEFAEAIDQSPRKNEFDSAEGIAEDLYLKLHLSKKAEIQFDGWDLASDSDQREENLKLIEYGMIFAHMHIRLLKERYVNTAEIYGLSVTDDQVSLYYEELASYANLYTEYFTWIEPVWKNWRKSEHTKFEIEKIPSFLPNGVRCKFKYTMTDELDELATEEFVGEHFLGCDYEEDPMYKTALDYYHGTWIAPVYAEFTSKISSCQKFNDACSSERNKGETCFDDTNCVSGLLCDHVQAEKGICEEPSRISKRGHGETCVYDTNCDQNKAALTGCQLECSGGKCTFFSSTFPSWYCDPKNLLISL